MSEVKSTYKFAKGELAGDIKRNPTTRKAYVKTKKTISKIKNPKKIKVKPIKRGKSITTEEALKKLKKRSPKSTYKKVKYKKKKLKQIKSDVFSIRI